MIFARGQRKQAAMTYENILVETDAGVGIIRLNRPKALNALNNELIAELRDRKSVV